MFPRYNSVRPIHVTKENHLLERTYSPSLLQRASSPVLFEKHFPLFCSRRHNFTCSKRHISSCSAREGISPRSARKAISHCSARKGISPRSAREGVSPCSALFSRFVRRVRPSGGPGSWAHAASRPHPLHPTFFLPPSGRASRDCSQCGLIVSLP